MESKGFTLIELLVVIAIIGILSSIALTSLGGARKKANDTTVVSQLSHMRKLAELVSLDQGDYNTVCQAATDSKDQFDLAEDSSGNTGVCNDSAGSWAASIELPSSTDGDEVYYCVDSTGVAVELTTQITTETACE
jgi:prepilin-type N-terminal cleavage/methylation domain-containing protein